MLIKSIDHINKRSEFWNSKLFTLALIQFSSSSALDFGYFSRIKYEKDKVYMLNRMKPQLKLINAIVQNEIFTS